MARSGIKALSECDVTPPGEQMLDFDDETFKAIAEVYNNEGNDEYLKKHYSNAVYFYTEGIKVNSKDDDLKAELYSNRAEAHFCLGNYSDSLRDAKAATDLQPSLVTAITAGANACVKLNMFEEAITWCEKGLVTAKENSTLLELRNLSLTCADKRKSNAETGATNEKLSQEKNEWKHGAHNRAQSQETTRGSLDITAYKNSDFKTDQEYLELELSEAKEAGDKEREGAAYLNLGLAYSSFNDFKTAIAFYKHALNIFKEVGDKTSEGLAYNHLGNAYDSLGDFKNAVEFHQQALSIAKLIGSKDLEGKAYRNLGNAYDCLGDFKKAIELHQQALSIAKNIGSQYLEGCAYLGLGNGYDSLGDLKNAIEFHQQALSIAKEVESKDLEGKAYLNLGNAYHSLGDFKEAIEFHQQALSIAKIMGSKDSEAKAYLNLGNAYDSLGDFKNAIEFHQRALNIAIVIGNKDSEGNAYNNLGLAYGSLGDFKKSIEFHQQALSIAEDTGNKDSEGNAYGNLGLVYECLGDFRNAIEFHQHTLSIAKDIGNENSEGTAYLNLGNAYESLGDFKKAIEYNQQALSIAKKVGSKDLEGKAYLNLGNAYHSLGDFKKAIEFHHQGLSIAKEIGNKDSEGAAYMNLGNAYSRLADFEEAIEFHQQALRIAKETGRKYTEEKAYINLGLACLALGDVIKGIEFHQQALRIAKDIGSKDSEGMAYLNLGNANFFLGNIIEAIEFHEQALIIAKEAGHKYLEGKAYLSLGLAYDSLGDFSRAEDFFKSSVRSFDEMRDLLQSNDEWKIGLRSQYDMAYSNLWRLQIRQNKTTEALFTAERGRAQALMDLMELQYGVKSARPVSGDQMETISCISSYLPSLTIFLAEAPNSVNFWVLRNGEQCQFIRKEINNNLESLIDETYKQIGVFEDVMCENRSLDEQADDDSEELPNRSPVNGGLASSDKVDALTALSDVVIGPISHLMQDDEAIIVPDGPLFLVPYDALVDQHSRYLSETVSIRLIPSLTFLKLMTECPEGSHSTSGALLVGDPLVENVRIKGKAVEQLPSAKREAEMIGKILKIEPLTGKDATKAQVLGRLKSVALVHIAAHGCPETGQILLSPNHGSSKTPNEKDYLLTMADVLNTKLHARLVVLSCCHSGRGKIKAEGVVGIARAFLGAGARSVLASLWAIDDDATLEFMKKFYEPLIKGHSARKSVNQAMKWMRESDKFSAVKYWAPFVLIGDDVTFNFGETSNVSAQ